MTPAGFLARFLSMANVLLIAGCSARRGAPLPGEYAIAKKITAPGLHDFGKINDYLYRGAQPKPQGIEELKKLGIDTIVDLRGERYGLMEKERACGVIGNAVGEHFWNRLDGVAR